MRLPFCLRPSEFGIISLWIVICIPERPAAVAFVNQDSVAASAPKTQKHKYAHLYSSFTKTSLIYTNSFRRNKKLIGANYALKNDVKIIFRGILGML